MPDASLAGRRTRWWLARPSVRFKRDGEPEALILTPAATLGLALWAGLLAGLLELAGELGGRALVGDEAWLGFYQLNRHYLWMTPGASVLIFGCAGVMLAPLVWARPRKLSALAVFCLGLLAILTPLMTVHRIHPGASLVLAAGASARLLPWLRARAGRVRRFVWRSALAFVVFLAGLVAFSFARESLRERRLEARAAAAVPGAPNVLLVVLDAVRADALSPYGSRRDTTPVLSRLAREGVRFENARSTAPWTLPSHGSLFTGQWPHQLRTGPKKSLDRTYPTLAQFLGAHGYDTAGFAGNYVFCTRNYGLNRGFAHYEERPISVADVLGCSGLGRLVYPSLGMACDAVTRWIPALALRNTVDPAYITWRRSAEEINQSFLTWLSGRQGRPFFAFLNYFDAHAPYIMPAGETQHFGRKPETRADYRTLFEWEKTQGDSRLSPAGTITVSESDKELVRDGYDDCLAYIDRQLGRLLSTLEERGVLRNTLVIVTSDHGEELGEHGLFGHFVSLHRAELEIPLLVVFPSRVPAGVSVAEPVSHRNVPATVADLLGYGHASPFPGQSLARHWNPARQGEGAGPDPVYAELAELRMQSLRVGSKVYVHHDIGLEQLFDLKDDPGEHRNLAQAADQSQDLERARNTVKAIRALPSKPPHARAAP